MNLLEKIRDTWEALGELASLLAAARVYVGQAKDATLPYCTVVEAGRVPLVRCNDGAAVDLVTVRTTVYHEDYAAGAAIVAAMLALYERTDFALSGSDRCESMQRISSSQAEGDDGVWVFVTEWGCRVYLAAGV